MRVCVYVCQNELAMCVLKKLIIIIREIYPH